MGSGINGRDVTIQKDSQEKRKKKKKAGGGKRKLIKIDTFLDFLWTNIPSTSENPKNSFSSLLIKPLEKKTAINSWSWYFN
ncbi:hypothetical protein AGMMS49531_07560 [Endomicrobiia bacterium]|nr:hypothetical protein AGMMS49531_07560 [Endomicrobiia bacterium]